MHSVKLGGRDTVGGFNALVIAAVRRLKSFRVPLAPSHEGSEREDREREQLIEQFRSKLNEEQERDGRKPYSYARLAKRFDGVSDSRLYQLFQECAGPGVRSFGAMMSWKLKSLDEAHRPPA